MGDNSIYGAIDRLRYLFAGPVYAPGGYRIDKLEIGVGDVVADIDFSEPLLGFCF